MRSRPLMASLLGLALMVAPGSGAAQEPPGSVGVAFVPVLRFWSPERDVALDEVRSAIEGRSAQYTSVTIGAEDPAALWEALGVTPAGSVRTTSVDEVRAAVERSHKTLGLLPAGQVGPDVRALSVDGVSLFGGDRIRDLGSWPLLATGPDTFDPMQTWTLVAGGDVMLDREPHRRAVIEGRGPDYPWDGGFAEITSRTCCTADGGPAITVKRVGPRGAVRDLLSGADIAVVNHEAPAPDQHSYHASGLVFSVDPTLLPGIADAGVDIVSLANNHIRNAGSVGVRDTIRNLRAAGIRTVGAGRDPARARKPACFERDELQVCLLGYNAINTVSHAVSDTRAGSAELVSADVRSDIHALRRDGADVIVVLPHWGPEYVTRVFPQQRRQARAMVRAGADVVLGAHSHVTGPLEFIDGVPVAYSMGDLIFDLPRFEATEEGVLVELTFHGPELTQLELHPTVIVDRAQVNLLRRNGDGDVVIARMRKASKQLY